MDRLRKSLRQRTRLRDDLQPAARAHLHIRIVSLRFLAVVPILLRRLNVRLGIRRRGLHHRRRGIDRVRISDRVWEERGSPDTDADKNPRPEATGPEKDVRPETTGNVPHERPVADRKGYNPGSMLGPSA